ncbi:MAG: hypothetical protein AAGF47_05230 [Planctomycetota bacterium]
MNVVEKLRQLHSDIIAAEDGFKVVDAWSLAERLLARLPVDAGQTAAACRAKDADALDGLIASLESPGSTEAAPPPAAEGRSFSHDDKSAAMRAFKKRLKLAKLNDESRLGGRYTSGGKTSAIGAIQPPDGFPAAMWPALVAEGRLRDAGQGFYALPSPS